MYSLTTKRDDVKTRWSMLGGLEADGRLKWLWRFRAP